MGEKMTGLRNEEMEVAGEKGDFGKAETLKAEILK